MLIKVDYRDAELYNRCNTIILSNVEKYSCIKIEKENLPLGDIIIYDDNGKEKTIIERKSLTDLASSIRDGRYSEQSFRLNQCSLHNHNIFYVIEGDLRTYKPFKCNIDKKALLSSMISISFFKGFSVFRTVNMDETAEWIVQFAFKINKEGTNVLSFYDSISNANISNANISNANISNANISNANISNANISNANIGNANISNANITTTTSSEENVETNTNTNTIINTNIQYSDVISRVKKNNITPSNIGSIMLSQIPNVSSTTANIIIEKFGSIKSLIAALQESSTALDSISVTTKNGQSRKLNKTVISNIYNYLLPPSPSP
jgi:ERCC4-type nuclease